MQCINDKITIFFVLFEFHFLKRSIFIKKQSYTYPLFRGERLFWAPLKASTHRLWLLAGLSSSGGKIRFIYVKHGAGLKVLSKLILKGF